MSDLSKRDQARERARILTKGTPVQSGSGDIAEDSELRALQRQDVIVLARRTGSLAAGLTVVVVVFGVVTVIAGLLIANSKELTETGYERTRLSFGIGLAIGGLVQSCIGLMVTQATATVAQYIRYKAEFAPIRE